SHGAHREAVAQYERALRCADALDTTDRAGLFEELALEGNYADRVDRALEARRAALAIWRAAGDERKTGENLCHLARLLVLAGQSASADEVIGECVALL